MATQRRPELAIIFATVFLYLLGFGIVIPIIPLLSRDFGASPLQSGLLMSVYSLMQFVFAPFWGRLSDRFGRRPILLFCLLGEGLSYLLFAAARNLELLFLARILAGFFGASLSTASAAISDVTPPNERSKGMALIGAAFGLGFVFGPALGGALTVWGQHLYGGDAGAATSFTMVWVAALCFANFLFGVRFLKETLKAEHRSTRKRGRFSVLFEKATIPVVGPLMGVFFLASLAMSSMEANLILYMGEKFAWTVQQVSFGFAYIGVMIVFTQGFLVRRMIPKLGERTTLMIGLASFLIGLIGIPTMGHVVGIAVAMTFLALGNGLTNPSTLGSISVLTPVDEQGATLGATQSLASLGRILGPAIGGFIYQRLAIQAPFWLSSVMAFGALAIVIAMMSRLPDAGRSKGAH